MSRKSASLLFAAALACLMAAPAFAQNGHERVFRGEIGDTQCALNVHSLSQSHKEMMAMRPELISPADCARPPRFKLAISSLSSRNAVPPASRIQSWRTSRSSSTSMVAITPSTRSLIRTRAILARKSRRSAMASGRVPIFVTRRAG